MPSTIRRAMSVFFVLTGAVALAAPSVASAQARGGGGGAPSRASAGPSRSTPAPSAQGAPRTAPAGGPVAPSRGGTVVSRGPAGQPVTGGAVTRTPGSGPVFIGHPIYGSPGYGYGYGYPYYPYYGYGYPYYGFGFSYGYPYYGYPYYGYPYYGYGGYGYYGPAVSIGMHVDGSVPVHAEGGTSYIPSARMGSIRLRIDPSSAQVYIDGALAGTVDDFNGLSSHLELEAGPHDLEVRAKGFQTYKTHMLVEADRTTTMRASLKKN